MMDAFWWGLRAACAVLGLVVPLAALVGLIVSIEAWWMRRRRQR